MKAAQIRESGFLERVRDKKMILRLPVLLVNNAHVTKTDIAASNGVIHVIDTVLLPE